MKVAVIGTGITGLSAAWALARQHQVVVYEQEARLGGHSHTVDVPAPGGGTTPVDTGFIVFNDATYPNLIRLLEHLGVPAEQSDMSFSVSLDDGRLEYAGTDSLVNLFAQKRNLVSPRFWGMLRDILRFYREAPVLLDQPGSASLSLGELLARGGYGRAFIYDHLLPMGAAIWSTPADEMLAFPAVSFIRFCANHGLLKVSGRPIWRTVRGGSRSYVERISAPFRDQVRAGSPVVAVLPDGQGVTVRDAAGADDRFDQVVIATHADQALALLAQPDEEQRRLLGAFRYLDNTTVLHGDPGLMPRRRGAWASWNYLADTRTGAQQQAVAVTYWMNRLQNLPAEPPRFVTLNPPRSPKPETVLFQTVYQHPAFDRGALAAQGLLARLQGRQRLWFCGAYFGHGFHEDGLSAGLAVAEALGASRPWSCADSSPAGRNATPLQPLEGGV